MKLWKETSVVVEQLYPKPRGAGRRPTGIERMLPIYFIQHWFNLSDPVTEEALYDSRVLPGLLYGEEPRVCAGSAYSEQKQAITDHAPQARDFARAKGSGSQNLGDTERIKDRNRSRVGVKVAHRFNIPRRRRAQHRSVQFFAVHGKSYHQDMPLRLLLTHRNV